MKKRIYNEVDKQLKVIQDKNTDRYNELVNEHFGGETSKPREKKGLWLFLPAAAAVLLIISLTLIINGLVKQSRRYSTDNEMKAEATIAEVQAQSKGFGFSLDGLEKFSIGRVYDSESGDNLYYYISVKQDDITANIFFITNPNYKHPFDTIDSKSREFKGLEADYLVEYEKFLLSGRVAMRNNNQRICLDFRFRTLEYDEEPVWMLLEQIIDVI